VDDGWTISVPSEDLGIGGTVFIGPFMMRDPDHLTVDQFFQHLEDGTDTHAKSERLYMKEIIFGGFPLSLLKKVLAERREDFFEKVWKPLLAYNVIDNITFQLSSPLKEAREFLSDLRDEQIQEISHRLDTYLEGQGVEGQGVEVDDTDGAKEEEGEGEEAEAWEAEDAEEEDAEYEEEEDEEAEEEPAPKKRTGTKLKKALGTLDTVLPEEEGNSHLDAHCESIRSFDTKGDILFEYVKSLYIVLTDTDIEKLSTDLPKLQAFVAQMKAIQIPQVPEEMKEIILVFKDYLASLDALIEKQLKSKKPKRGETPYATEFDELKSISDMLKMYICRGYLIAKSKGPAPPAARRGGSRKTRRLSKSSHRV
jgi:nucleotide-binding universal stress UspA family protein